MPNDPTAFRRERIEKLLHELNYEITRGMLEGEIDEEINYRFYVPTSKRIANGLVSCRFETRPIPAYMVDPRDNMPPRLRVVGGERDAS